MSLRDLSYHRDLFSESATASPVLASDCSPSHEKMDPRLDIALLAAISHIKQNRVWCGMLGVGCYGGHVDGGVDS